MCELGACAASSRRQADAASRTPGFHRRACISNVLPRLPREVPRDRCGEDVQRRRAGRDGLRPFSDIRCPDRVATKAAARPHARLPEDTINVLDTENIQHIVRLAGINAPERKQPFSEVAHQHLAALVLLRDVVVD
jgi:hypothetical protein